MSSLKGSVGELAWRLFSAGYQSKPTYSVAEVWLERPQVGGYERDWFFNESGDPRGRSRAGGNTFSIHCPGQPMHPAFLQAATAEWQEWAPVCLSKSQCRQVERMLRAASFLLREDEGGPAFAPDASATAMIVERKRYDIDDFSDYVVALEQHSGDWFLGVTVDDTLSPDPTQQECSIKIRFAYRIRPGEPHALLKGMGGGLILPLPLEAQSHGGQGQPIRFAEGPVLGPGYSWPTAVSSPASDAGPSASTQPAEPVWVTRHGLLYHRQGCVSFPIGATALPLAEARLRYQPCPRCCLGHGASEEAALRRMPAPNPEGFHHAQLSKERAEAAERKKLDKLMLERRPGEYDRGSDAAGDHTRHSRQRRSSDSGRGTRH